MTNVVSPYTAYILDASNQRVEQLSYTRLECVLRYSDFGRFSFDMMTLPNTPITFDTRVRIEREGIVIMTGTISRVEKTYKRGVHSYYIFGNDDIIYLKTRLALPDPAGPPYNVTHDVRTGFAEDIISDYIKYNLGSLAKTDRQVAGFTVATSQGRGLSLTRRARFENLLDLVQDIALQGGIGFQVKNLSFSCFVPNDVSGSVVFSEEMGNIVDYDYVTERSKGNYVYVGGSGEGVSRLIYERRNTDSIAISGRVELFVDRRDTDSQTALYNAALAELEKNSEKIQLHVVPGAEATEKTRAFVDFYLGDTVTAIVDDAQIQAQVTEIGIIDRVDEVHERASIGAFGTGLHNLIPGISSRDTMQRISRLEVSQ